MADATHIQIPADFERLPEYRLLCVELKGKLNPEQADSLTRFASIAEMAATFLWLRLQVELAYQAKTTNRPGWLTASGVALFEESVEDMFGEDCEPLELLARAGLLRREGSEYVCDRFAKENAHWSGDYVKREVRGAAASALVRQQQNIAKEAAAQAMLLPPEVFRKRDGQVMDSQEVQRSMVVIATLDNCLKKRTRQKTEFNEGLICDAYAVAEKHPQEKLREVYLWIANHREHPRLPKTTEQILADWSNVLAMAGVTA